MKFMEKINLTPSAIQEAEAKIIGCLNGDEEEFPRELEIYFFYLDPKYLIKYAGNSTLGRRALSALLEMSDEEANKWMLLYVNSAGAEMFDFMDDFIIPMIKIANEKTLMAICERVILSDEQQLSIFNRPNAKKFIKCIKEVGAGLQPKAYKKAIELNFI